MGGQPGDLKLSEHLSRVRIGLRPELEVTRQLFQGRVFYIIRDPITLESHKITLENYEIFIRLRRESSLGETFRDLVEEGKLTSGQEEDFYRFVYQLHEIGFLQLPFSDGKRLYRRFLLKKRGQWFRRLAAPFFLQIPLLNPDNLLDRSALIFRALFSRPFFILWILVVGSAGLLAVGLWSDLTSRFYELFAIQNLIALWVCLILIKALHELGHACACKAFGGTVPEMGVYLIALTPCAYVDASSSWGFSRKWERIVVCLAGIYVELFVAAIAVFIWSFTGPGFLNSLMQNIVFLASVTTIGFNLNPLMRFDGYYTLSDILEIPNLRQRSGACARSLLKRIFLGIKEDPGDEGPFNRIFLFFFGIASWCYRLTVVLFLCSLVAGKLFLLGLVLAELYISIELYRLLRRLFRYLLFSSQTASRRLRALTITIIITACLPVGLFILPASSHVVVGGVVSAEEKTVILVERPGFLKALHCRDGDVVRPGELIAELEDPAFQRALIEAEAKVRRSRIRVRALEAGDQGLASKERRFLQFHQKNLDTWRAEREKLRIRAPRKGMLLNGLTERDVGRYLGPGEPVATLASGRRIVECYLREDQVEEARPAEGAPVQFLPAEDPSNVYQGTILRVRSAREHRIEAVELTQAGGGEIPVDPITRETPGPYFQVTAFFDHSRSLSLLRQGMTGSLRLGSRGDSLAVHLQRKLIRFLDRIQKN